jgi:hypothetical protein
MIKFGNSINCNSLGGKNFAINRTCIHPMLLFEFSTMLLPTDYTRALEDFLSMIKKLINSLTGCAFLLRARFQIQAWSIYPQNLGNVWTTSCLWFCIRWTEWGISLASDTVRLCTDLYSLSKEESGVRCGGKDLLQNKPQWHLRLAVQDSSTF